MNLNDVAQALPGKSVEAFTQWLSQRARQGAPPLLSANQLAKKYLDDPSYADDEARLDALIRWETGKSFTAGFVAGLAGFAALPVSVPATLAADWLLQARLAAAVAVIRGYDLAEPDVQTMVLTTLLGAAAPDALRSMGVRAGEWATRRIVRRVSESALHTINRKVGFALLSTASRRGLVSVGRAVPVVGAAVGGAFDAYGCRKVATMARSIFTAQRFALPAHSAAGS